MPFMCPVMDSFFLGQALDRWANTENGLINSKLSTGLHLKGKEFLEMALLKKWNTVMNWTEGHSMSGREKPSLSTESHLKLRFKWVKVSKCLHYLEFPVHRAFWAPIQFTVGRLIEIGICCCFHGLANTAQRVEPPTWNSQWTNDNKTNSRPGKP